MKRVGDLNDPHIAALYADVPAERLAEFQAFREAFPYHDVTLDGVAWSYLDGGAGDPPVLLLSGALAIPDISWSTITGLAARRRVIVPAYPPVTTMDALADGIAGLLRQAGIEQVAVVGGSYGGFVAQVFVRRYPKMTRSLVLSHTLPPAPETAPRVRRSVRMLRWMPMRWVRPLMHRVFGSMMPEQTEETACLIAIYNELIEHTLTKKDGIGILARTADYATRSFAPEDLSDWPGKILLIFGAEDAATPPEARQKLAALYPGCEVRVFEGAGHTTSVTQRDAYLAALTEFL